MEFIKGKWYKDITSEQLYVKYDKPNNHTYTEAEFFHSSEKISNNNHKYLLNDNWTKGIPRNWVEVTDLSEIQQYLPENHPDKIKTIEKWSIGSYLVALEDRAICINNFYKGDIAIISNINTIKLSNGSEWSCGESNEDVQVKWFATKKEAEIFAASLSQEKQSDSLVGRYVKALKHNGGGLKEGTLGVVKCINKHDLTVNFENDKSHDIVLGEYFELMPEGFNPNTVSKELTIDDLVEGEIYTTLTNGPVTIFNCDLKNTVNTTVYGHKWLANEYFCDSRGAWKIESTLKLATPQEKKHLNVCIKQNKFISQDQLDLYDDNTFELKTVMKNNFKVGDYVVVLDDVWGMCAEINHCYKITEVGTNYLYKPHYGISKERKLRYATPEEIAEYDRLGKPYDVTTLVKQTIRENTYEVIVLNSKEEMVACEKYFNSISYTKTSGHNNYSDKFKYFIIYHDTKQYQNLITPCNYPIVTLEKFGIIMNNKEPKYDYEVVHCTTQEEWDFVISKTNDKAKNCFNNYPKNAITFNAKDKTDIGCYCSVDYYKNQDSKIYSFQEWCDKFGYTMKVKEEEYRVGDWAIVASKGIVGCDVYNHGKHPIKIAEINGDTFRYELDSDKSNYLKGISSYYSLVNLERKALPREIPNYPINIDSAKSEEFVLPEKWCLSINEESRPYISEYTKNSKNYGYTNDFLKSDFSYADYSIKVPTKKYPEITLEQFQKYVLKSEPTQSIQPNEPKTMSKEELIEEARRRYSIGTTYKCPRTHDEYIVERNTNNSFTIIHENCIDAGMCKGYFYYEGEWAKIISYGNLAAALPEDYVNIAKQTGYVMSIDVAQPTTNKQNKIESKLSQVKTIKTFLNNN